MMIKSKIILTMTNGEVIEKKQPPLEQSLKKAEIDAFFNTLFKRASHFTDCKDGHGVAYNLANVVKVEYIEEKDEEKEDK